ncbi:MAG TPA: hypothetical protein VFN35_03555 [Ktedonobacteraceae bacterium]|nr:hypothetical protein [Ktedonobacteraceae bacterium]
MKLTTFLKYGTGFFALCLLLMIVRLPLQAQASPTPPSVLLFFIDHATRPQARLWF